MKIKSIIATLVLVAVPFCAFAQSEKSNEALSKDLQNQISIINADIKALKARKKADPTNTEYVTQINQKQEELKTAKERKKVIDNAISAAKKSEKQTKQAEDAQKKYEKAHKKAEEMRETAGVTGKSNEQLRDEYDSQIDILKADIKSIKARKKADPSNTTLESDLKQKENELKEITRRKKIIEDELKTSKTAEKKADKAEDAQKNNEKASNKANDLRKEM